MTDAHEAKQATPHATLLAELLDSRIPKSEREHAAKREIERLTAERNALRDDNAKLNGWMEEEAQAAGRLQSKLNTAEDDIERMTEENRRLRADLLAGRNVVNAGLTIHTLTLERDMLRQEIERLTAALRVQPGPVSMDDVEWAGKAHLHDAQQEIERLRAALKRANDQTEHFEREWYLRGDENEKLRAALVAAMEVVKAERERITQYDFVEPKRAEELDAIIAQADAALGREG